LETVAHCRRRILTPQRVDDLFCRDDAADGQCEHGEQRAQLRAGVHHAVLVVIEHLEPA